MNSLRDVFSYLTDSQFESVLLSQTEVDPNYESDDDVKAGKAMRDRLNEEAELSNPVVASGWRSSDVDVMNSAADQRVVNVLASRLRPVHIESQLPKGLTDEQLVESAVDRHLDMSDLDNYVSEIQPVSEPEPSAPEPPKSE